MKVNWRYWGFVAGIWCISYALITVIVDSTWLWLSGFLIGMGSTLLGISLDLEIGEEKQ